MIRTAGAGMTRAFHGSPRHPASAISLLENCRHLLGVDAFLGHAQVVVGHQSIASLIGLNVQKSISITRGHGRWSVVVSILLKKPALLKARIFLAAPWLTHARRRL
jgi:hypothetical protein